MGYNGIYILRYWQSYNGYIGTYLSIYKTYCIYEQQKIRAIELIYSIVVYWSIVEKCFKIHGIRWIF